MLKIKLFKNIVRNWKINYYEEKEKNEKAMVKKKEIKTVHWIKKGNCCLPNSCDGCD